MECGTSVRGRGKDGACHVGVAAVRKHVFDLGLNMWNVEAKRV